MGGLGNQELPLYSAFSYNGYRAVPVSRLGFNGTEKRSWGRGDFFGYYAIGTRKESRTLP